MGDAPEVSAHESVDLGPARPYLTGRSDDHLCSREDAERVGAHVHRDVVAPFDRLMEDAAGEGFDLRILSGFRSFHQQLSIWNRKVGGELPVLDRHAAPLDIGRLTEKELVFAILKWSALPGASRHHWGTDLDVFDAAAKPAGYEIELVPGEVEPGGMFGPLHDWLDRRMADGKAFGFFRPYDRDRGGVAAERWHLSCAPVATPLEKGFTLGLLKETLEGSELLLKEVVLGHLDEIYHRFVVNVARAP